MPTTVPGSGPWYSFRTRDIEVLLIGVHIPPRYRVVDLKVLIKAEMSSLKGTSSFEFQIVEFFTNAGFVGFGWKGNA
jgi:hypothetical protein